MVPVTDGRPAGRKTARLSGFALLLLATVVAGVAAYVVTVLVPAVVGLANYAFFAVFWSSIYLLVGALSGIQQEVTRATRPIGAEATPAHRASKFAFVAASVVVVAIVATAPLWVRAVFPTEGWLLVWPLALGAGSYVLVAVLAGSLYGISRWVPLAGLIVADALLRLIALGVVLLFTKNLVALAWAVAVPFPAAIALLWPFIRRSIVGRSELDVGYRAISWNVLRTVLAAASTAAMVSGFPLLLGLASAGQPKAIVGMYILTITLSRAPLIVVAMSLQSFFTVTFRDSVGTFWVVFLRLQAAILAGGLVLAALGWIIGPDVFAFLFPRDPQPDGWFIAVLVLSSALMASLCVTAPAVLARSQHLVYSLGWFAAAVATIVALMLPLDFTARTVTALFVGPAVGLVVHGTFLVRANRAARMVSR
jgi:O-antigen/teichoic acid export membrane protein